MPPISGYFDIPFAENGDLNTIPDATQPSGTVSYNQGFPVLYSTPVDSGGYNVPRTAINQALNDITTAIQQYQQNGVPPFITTTMNGGSPYSYNAYAVVLYGGVVYQSLVGSNTDTPPSSKWITFNAPRRVTLVGNTTYFVATTGSDSSGTGTSGSPWATIQHAVTWITQNVDTAGFNVTISVANGTYSSGATVTQPLVGGGVLAIQGNTASPSNCVISTTGANGFTAIGYGVSVNLAGFDITTATSGQGIAALNGAIINIVGNMIFAAVPSGYNHQFCSGGGQININSNYTISGGGGSHHEANFAGQFDISSGITITVTGTPAFTGAFASIGNLSLMNVIGVTYSGSATGTRYNSQNNSVIQTGAGSASYFPGNSAGSTINGGLYL